MGGPTGEDGEAGRLRRELERTVADKRRLERELVKVRAGANHQTRELARVYGQLGAAYQSTGARMLAQALRQRTRAHAARAVCAWQASWCDSLLEAEGRARPSVSQLADRSGRQVEQLAQPSGLRPSEREAELMAESAWLAGELAQANRQVAHLQAAVRERKAAAGLRLELERVDAGGRLAARQLRQARAESVRGEVGMRVAVWKGAAAQQARQREAGLRVQVCQLERQLGKARQRLAEAESQGDQRAATLEGWLKAQLEKNKLGQKAALAKIKACATGQARVAGIRQLRLTLARLTRGELGMRLVAWRVAATHRKGVDEHAAVLDRMNAARVDLELRAKQEMACQLEQLTGQLADAEARLSAMQASAATGGEEAKLRQRVERLAESEATLEAAIREAAGRAALEEECRMELLAEQHAKLREMEREVQAARYCVAAAAEDLETEAQAHSQTRAQLQQATARLNEPAAMSPDEASGEARNCTARHSYMRGYNSRSPSTVSRRFSSSDSAASPALSESKLGRSYDSMPLTEEEPAFSHAAHRSGKELYELYARAARAQGRAI